MIDELGKWFQNGHLEQVRLGAEMTVQSGLGDCGQTTDLFGRRRSVAFLGEEPVGRSERSGPRAIAPSRLLL